MSSLDNKTPNKSEIPICPMCGVRMVKQAPQKNQSNDEELWWCDNYPLCKITVSTKKSTGSIFKSNATQAPQPDSSVKSASANAAKPPVNIPVAEGEDFASILKAVELHKQEKQARVPVHVETVVDRGPLIKKILLWIVGVLLFAMIGYGGYLWLPGLFVHKRETVVEPVKPVVPPKPVAPPPEIIAPPPPPKPDPEKIRLEKLQEIENARRAAEIAQHKREEAFKAFYQKPAECETPVDWRETVKCSNALMDAKARFEAQYREK